MSDHPPTSHPPPTTHHPAPTSQPHPPSHPPAAAATGDGPQPMAPPASIQFHHGRPPACSKSLGMLGMDQGSIAFAKLLQTDGHRLDICDLCFGTVNAVISGRNLRGFTTILPQGSLHSCCHGCLHYMGDIVPAVAHRWLDTISYGREQHTLHAADTI